MPEPVKLVALADQIRCVERELQFRHRVYARRVKEGSMEQAESDREITRMTAVLETLRDVHRQRQP